MKPKLFIGSSVEGLSVAYSIQQNLTYDADVTVWDQGVFALSKTTIESLVEILGKSDFGIFVFSPDDISLIRRENQNIVRDNVIFEFGLFIGKLTRERVFFIIPDGAEIHLPTDLLGITPGKYDPNREDKSLQAATGPVCHQIRLQIKREGLINPRDEMFSEPNEKTTQKSSYPAWVEWFLKKEYKASSIELEKKMQTEKDGEKLIELKSWLAYCHFKIDERIGIEYLEALVIDNEDSLEAHKLAARAFIWENYFDKAEAILTKAILKFGSDEALIVLLADSYQKNYGDQNALEYLNTQSPEKSIPVTLEMVRIYNEQKDYENARKIIHQAYLNYPNNEKLRYNYAQVASELDLNDISLFFLNELTIDFPKNSIYWGYLSNCSLSLELYDIALSACLKANELVENKESWLISNLGNIFNNKGFYSEAIKYLKKGIELSANSEYPHDRLSKALKLKKEEEQKLKSISESGKKKLREFKGSII